MQLTHYFLALLPNTECAVGPKLWKPRDVYETNILAAKYDDGVKMFPSHTEAIVITIIQSCHAKWQEMIAHWQTEGYSAKLPDKLHKADKKAGKVDEKNDSMHLALYTRQDEGRSRFGTFSVDGLNYFNDLTQEIKQARKANKKQTAAWESAFRQGIRERNNIGDDERASGKKGRRKRSAGAAAAPTPQKRAKVMLDLADTDDESGSEAE